MMGRGQTFDAALNVVRDQSVKLVCAITALKYLSAWIEACELRRVIQRADAVARAFADDGLRSAATSRLSELCLVAAQVLDNAPHPSPEAMRQVHSSDWRSDRSTWEREEAQWIATRAALGPLDQRERSRRRRRDTWPETPRALKDATGRVSLRDMPHTTSGAEMEPTAGDNRTEEGRLE